MSDAGIALLILAGIIALFVWNRLPVGVVALTAAVSLWATGLLDLNQAMSGFGDPVIVFIASLFVVSEGIDASGLTTWAGQQVIERAGEGRVRLLVLLMLLSAVLTALISLNGSAAALIPVAVLLALRTRQRPSQLLMPMVYAGSAGGLLILLSPVSILAAEASENLGAGGFGFFSIGLVGLPILVGTMALSVWLAPKVLPDRVPDVQTPDLSQHAETLGGYYRLDDGFYRLRIRPGSPLLGLAPDEVDLSAYPGLHLVGLQAATAEPQPVRHGLEPADVLVVSGPREQISRLVVAKGLAVTMRPVTSERPADLVNREMGVVEVVVPPRSPLVGEVVFPGMLRHGDVLILAIKRLGKDQAETEVEPGDAMLLYGPWPAVETLSDDHDVLVVDSPDLHRRQAVALGPKALRAGVILVGMVVLLAFDLVPPAIGGLLAAAAMVLTKVVSSPQAYRAVSWETVVLVGGLIPLSTALRESGAADEIADQVLRVAGDAHPLVLMVVLFGLIAVLGLVISNTATVLISLPIVIAAATETGISPQPVLMLTAVAASAALLTPVQTPANLMVMAPGGYRFGDYWRLGLPIMLFWLAVCLVVIPLVWPFSP